MENQFLQNALKSYEMQHDEAERMYNVTLDAKYSKLMAFYKEQIQIGLSSILS